MTDRQRLESCNDLVVWRVTLTSGEECHFGTEAMAKAWGRGSGKVERVILKPRPALEVVAPSDAEQPDSVVVPRELLDCAARSCANGWVDYRTANELRALLAGGAA